MRNPAYEGMMAARRENMATIEHGNTSGTATTLDNALYQASVICHRSADKSAVVCLSTSPDVADEDSGELYLILEGDSVVRGHLRNEQGWHEVYTVTAHA